MLEVELPWKVEVGRPRMQRRLPVVLSQEELAAVFRQLEGEHLILAQLLYGAGLRIAEGLQLRVKDGDFVHRAGVVREGRAARTGC